MDIHPDSTGHDITVQGSDRSGYVFTCRDHGCVHMFSEYSLAEVSRMFVCDDGTQVRFIVEHGDDPAEKVEPIMADLTDLATALRTHAEYIGHGTFPSVLRVWIWDSGAARRLRVSEVDGTGWDDNERRTATWAVQEADGSEHVRVTVTIDGRA